MTCDLIVTYAVGVPRCVQGPRLVGSAKALNTASTPTAYVTIKSHVNSLPAPYGMRGGHGHAHRQVAARSRGPLSTVPSVVSTPAVDAFAHPFTLAIDVGGTGLKASVLSVDGAMVTDRARVDTKYPMPPDGDSGLVGALARPLGEAPSPGRLGSSCGFPGMVRNGVVLSRASLRDQERSGHPGGPEVLPGLVQVRPLRRPVDRLRAADQGGQRRRRAGRRGRGGQGARGRHHPRDRFPGSALFMDGRLLPHAGACAPPVPAGTRPTTSSWANWPVRARATEHWNHRVREAIACLMPVLSTTTWDIGAVNALGSCATSWVTRSNASRSSRTRPASWAA